MTASFHQLLSAILNLPNGIRYDVSKNEPDSIFPKILYCRRVCFQNQTDIHDECTTAAVAAPAAVRPTPPLPRHFKASTQRLKIEMIIDKGRAELFGGSEA